MAATSLSSSFHEAAAVMCLLLLFLAPSTTAATLSVSSAETTLINGSCIAAERDALLSFRAAITSDPNGWLKSWRGLDCCRWYGVRCSTKTGHVLKLDLRNDFFTDDIVDNGIAAVHWLHGQISSSLLSLCHLKHLDLSGNALGDHKPIPIFLASLKSLTYLDLSNMNFSGQVPPQLGNLTELVHLDIHISQLNGYLTTYAASYAYTYTDANAHAYPHSSDVSWLGSLNSLEYLDLSGVNLSASVDWVHSVNLPNLKILYLSDCGLSSSTPRLLHNNLTVLEELHLSFNPFNSPAAPNWYWDITSLKSLYIYDCELLGPFPDELGNLTMLETLHMGANNIKGMLPSTLKNLCSLSVMELSYNNFGGDITDLIERLPKCSWNKLDTLYLHDGNITGSTLKSVLNLTALRFLEISSNYLTGSLPKEIGTLKKLIGLYVNDNNLSGVVSEDHFSNLMNLKAIDLSRTYVQVLVPPNWKPPFNLDEAYFSYCRLGPQIPNWFRWQPTISVLHMSNTGLIGRISNWFWTTFSNTTHLDLSYNQIGGDLPHNLEFMSVKELFLQSNHFTGSVPRLAKTIEVLDISKNSLNGELPSNFGAPYLQILVLFSNCITGIIPESICQMPQLRVLDLSNNQLTKGLPDCGRKDLKQLNRSSNKSSRVDSKSSYSLEIRTLLLNNNRLSGRFPLFLKQCQNLMFLDLSQNKFSGKLPAWISEAMPFLVMLRLRSNNFSDHIPIETMRLFSLRILDLADNTFSRVILQSLTNLKALTAATNVALDPTDNPFQEVFQSGYMLSKIGLSNDSLSLVTKGHVLHYRENAIFFMSIDLSCNKLSVQIPEEIGSLSGLINLNLSSNFLSGNIPYKICNLQALESLDLSNNQLSSEIPWCLSNLTSLSYLNLSYNNLSGRIPSGRQLDTLGANDPASMYIGNRDLCGYPFPKLCPEDQPVQEDPFKGKEDGKAQMDYRLGLIVGYLVGLWIIFCGLLFKNTWRYTYFGLFDKLYDKMWIFLVLTWQKWFRTPGTV